MHRYESRPGAQGVAPEQWPLESRIPRTPGKPTLVVVAHPKCTCTRASMEELAALMADNPGAVAAHVLFYKPAEAGDEWAETSLWRTAAAIPGVTVSSDAGGVEAQRFGGETSGEVLLYNAAGRLVFHGGITAVRGQAGVNAGLSSLALLLEGKGVRTDDHDAGSAAARTSTPVFGCPISLSTSSTRPAP